MTKSVTVPYFLGEGEGVGEGLSFLESQLPQLAWAMGAERVAKAMMKPARAKRSEVMFGVLGLVVLLLAP